MIVFLQPLLIISAICSENTLPGIRSGERERERRIAFLSSKTSSCMYTLTPETRTRLTYIFGPIGTCLDQRGSTVLVNNYTCTETVSNTPPRRSTVSHTPFSPKNQQCWRSLASCVFQSPSCYQYTHTKTHKNRNYNARYFLPLCRPACHTA